ncbi:hypothetical protein PIB30_031182 [Stylosanthes scabra]|uniref:Uncharacterized protein n=1 Tax=Stylosanthes scabra TaxID=79078 RepID=A0ABU6QCJ9_9FABA|nr:hypothetical protein [Stylosanthes scabra]
MAESIGGIVTNDLLESVAEIEQGSGGGGGEVAAPELEDLQAAKGEEGQGSGVPDWGREHRNHLEGGQQAKDPSELLEGAVIPQVRHVCPQVVHGCTRQHALQLVQCLQPRLHVVQPSRVQLQYHRPLDQRPRVFLHELHQLLQTREIEKGGLGGMGETETAMGTDEEKRLRIENLR